MIGGILVLFIYVTRLASNEIFSPSKKIHEEVGRAKDLSAPFYGAAVVLPYLYMVHIYWYLPCCVFCTFTLLLPTVRVQCPKWLFFVVP